MKPLFTIHAGEFLVGSFIEQRFRRANIWIPTRDTGIDLLVSDRNNHRTVSLQVKFSKDFLVTSMPREFQKELRTCGWFKADRKKLAASAADYWVLVLQGFGNRCTDYAVVPTKELQQRLPAIHAGTQSIQSYIWVTQKGKCWEARGLKRADQRLVASGEYSNKARDLTTWLNNWEPLARLNQD